MELSTWALLVIAVVALVGACLQRVSGMGLGLIMDFIMKRTGIDLTSRKIVEH